MFNIREMGLRIIHSYGIFVLAKTYPTHMIRLDHIGAFSSLYPYDGGTIFTVNGDIKPIKTQLLKASHNPHLFDTGSAFQFEKAPSG